MLEKKARNARVTEPLQPLDPRLPANWREVFPYNPTREAWAVQQALNAPLLSEEQIRRLTPLLKQGIESPRPQG